MTPRTPFYATLALVAAALAPELALAQVSSDEIARRDLIAQAEQASDHNDHAHALDLATRAGRLRMTTSLRLLIAQEHDALGHLLDALDFAGQCVRDAESDATLNNRARILAACNALTTSLQSRVSRITVEVPSPAPGLHVRVQGRELNQALWGISSPVLPGSVEVNAEATGGRTFHQTVELAPGASSTVTVTLSAETTPTPGPTPAPTPTPTPPPVGVLPPTVSSGPGAAPWILVGVGGASLITGFIFLSIRGTAISNRADACDATGCDPSAILYNNRAVTASAVVNTTFVAGIATVGAGLAWYFVARPHGERSSSTALRWDVSPTVNGATLGLSGAF